MSTQKKSPLAKNRGLSSPARSAINKCANVHISEALPEITVGGVSDADFACKTTQSRGASAEIAIGDRSHKIVSDKAHAAPSAAACAALASFFGNLNQNPACRESFER